MLQIRQITSTTKANILLNSGRYTKIELAEKIGIGRPTLDKRLLDHSWKKGEMEILKSI